MNAIAGPRSQRSQFWRELSYRVGDTHANRICWAIDIYCWLFRVDKFKFATRLP